jgi:cell filamentation protein
MTTRKYEASGVQAEFEPGSRDRVLRNLLGIVRERDMEVIETDALAIVQEAAPARYGLTHRFTTGDIRELHRSWLGHIYAWAGEYRTLDIGKGGFQFANAARVPLLMAEFESDVLQRLTPCVGSDHDRLAAALAEVHAELILIHPFRDGNGRLARLLAVLMAGQAGVRPLRFRSLDRQRRRPYVAAIHAAMGRNYLPLAGVFRRVIDETVASSTR